MNQKIRGQAFFRAVFFLPVVIASGLVVERLFQQNVGSLEAVVGLNIPTLVYMYLPARFADVVVDVLDPFDVDLVAVGHPDPVVYRRTSGDFRNAV